MQAISIIPVLVAEMDGHLVLAHLHFALGNWNLLAFEVGLRLLSIDLHVSDFDTAEIKPYVWAWHFNDFEVDSGVTCVPGTLGKH